MTRYLRYARTSHGALAKNEQHGFAARYALSHYRSNTVYSFIPKNGCTTMRYSFGIANGCIQDCADFEWVHENNRTFSASLRELACANYSFVILRCPYARLVSAFTDKIIHVEGKPKNGHLFNFRKASGYSAEDVNDLSFRLFCEALAKPAVLRADVHWRPQVDYLVYDEYDSYFRLEDFSEAVHEIERNTGILIQDARHLSRHGTDQLTLVSDRCYADTPLRDLIKMKTAGCMPAHDAFYDPDLRHLVGDVFKMDFAFLEGKFPTPKTALSSGTVRG